MSNYTDADRKFSFTKVNKLFQIHSKYWLARIYPALSQSQLVLSKVNFADYLSKNRRCIFLQE